PSSLRRATVMDLGDVRMVHQRQRLALGLKAGNDLPGVHAQLDDLEGDPATNRFLLLGHIDNPAAALANFLEQLVTPDLVSGFLCQRNNSGRSGRRVLKKLTGLYVRGEER